MALAELDLQSVGLHRRGESPLEAHIPRPWEHWKFLLKKAPVVLLDPRIGMKLASGIREAEREIVELALSHTFWGHGVPRGHGEPVIVVPGLGGGDRDYKVRRLWLNRMGYDARPSGINRNIGNLGDRIAELDETVQEVSDETGQAVIIDGHSMGGVQGKVVATRRPDRVRQLITEGAPLVTPQEKVPSIIHRLAIKFTEGFVNNERLAEELNEPLREDQDFVSMYSLRDHIVHASATHHPAAKHIEVNASHLGMPFSTHSYRRVGNVLAA